MSSIVGAAPMAEPPPYVLVGFQAPLELSNPNAVQAGLPGVCLCMYVGPRLVSALLCIHMIGVLVNVCLCVSAYVLCACLCEC